MVNELKLKKLVSLVSLGLLVLGLVGSFLSTLFSVDKIHYYLLFPLFLFLASTILIEKYLNVVFALALLSLFYLTSGPYTLLSFFSVFIMPLLFFKAGEKLDLTIFIQGINALVLLFFIGFVIEYFNIKPDSFPFIGYELNGELKRRFGSFTLNPLALGYFAVYSVFLCSLNKNKFIKISSLVMSIILLLFANSRACYAIFFLGVIIYSFRSKNRAYLFLLFPATIFLLFYSPLSSRFLSILNWRSDIGNLGRINQWVICAEKIPNNFFFGIGPGTFSPLGGDISYYGVIKSCESLPLMIFLEYGLFIFLFYFFVLFRYWRLSLVSISQQDNKSSPNKELSTLFAINFAALLSQVFNQSFQGIFFGGIFFLLFGFIYYKKN